MLAGEKQRALSRGELRTTHPPFRPAIRARRSLAPPALGPLSLAISAFCDSAVPIDLYWSRELPLLQSGRFLCGNASPRTTGTPILAIRADKCRSFRA